MTVAIVSASFGEYDTPKQHVPQSIDVDWVNLTTNPWMYHPRLAAKIPKFKPWDFTDDHDVYIWIDGSAEIVSANFAADVVQALGDGDIGQFPHPWRDCIYDEGAASKELLKYQGLRIDDQLAHYRIGGHPEHWGLWATGVIAWHRNQRTERLAHEWFTECRLWTYQDQLSQAPLLRLLGIDIRTFNQHLISNPWLVWVPHTRED